MIKNFQKTFNKVARDDYWEKNKQKIDGPLENFEAHCIATMAVYNKMSSIPAGFKRTQLKNGFGYNGTNAGNGIQSGIQTENTIGLKSKEYTHDHLIGATQVGKIIFEFLMTETNWEDDKVREKWLYNHLYLWGTIKVSKKEHAEENIGRGPKHSVANRILFKHYINVSPLVLTKK